MKAIAQWLRAILAMRQEATWQRDQPTSNDAETITTGDVVFEEERTAPIASSTQPVFLYHTEYPVMLLSEQKSDYPCIEQPRQIVPQRCGWVVVFADKIIYQPRAGAWLQQRRMGMVLATMVKHAMLHFSHKAGAPVNVHIQGYDKQLKQQLRDYVVQHPVLREVS